VGGKRKGFDVAVIDDRRVLALQGRLTCQQVVDLVMANPPGVAAIDSPRSCAPRGQTAREGELQPAKSICGIRWTPEASRVHASAYYAWIIEGLALFDALIRRGVEVIRVFPAASWTRWHGKRGSRTRAAWTRQGLAALGLAGVPVRVLRPGCWGYGQDRDGPFRVGGQALMRSGGQQAWMGSGRPVKSIEGQQDAAADYGVRPPPGRWASGGRAEVGAGLEGDVALEAADFVIGYWLRAPG
jgi:predicted nuclease with RNAse H fold